MLKILQKNTNILKKPDEDFIPYVCHYNKDTILTKNGELLKVIRISGGADNALLSDVITLRDSIRDSIHDNVKTNDIAFWFHTIRRRKSVISKSELGFTDFFSKEVDKEFNNHNDWGNKFVNELYITVLHQGLESSLGNTKNFFNSLSYKATQESHKKYLLESSKKLDVVCNKIMSQIKDFGANILSIYEWENILYSQPARFFGKIINLYEERYPLSVNDMSNDLASHKIAFNGRNIEIKGYENKNFATIFSIKEYHEISIESLEKILDLPFEFIISQSFDFLPDEKEIEKYKYQEYILKNVSEDEYFLEASGILNFFEVNKKDGNEYGNTQITITIIANSLEELDNDVLIAVEKFSSLGFILIREDIFSEHCYWSQLPGNFSYLRRQKAINTLRIGGFASLSNFPSGNIYGNYWGPSISTLKTILNSPYFFNFHDGEVGHTLIMGPEGSGKTVLTNFLISQAQKIGCNINYFDFNGSSKSFITCLLGKNYKISRDINDPEFMQLNPFSLPPTAENVKFLTSLIEKMLLFLKTEISDEEIDSVSKIINSQLQNPSNSFLNVFDALRNNATMNVYEKLKIWGSGKLAYIFGSQNDINWLEPIKSFDLKDIINQKPVLIPVLSYILYQIESNLSNKPTIIVFDEVYEFLDNEVMISDFERIIKRLESKNCLVIFSTKNHRYISDSNLTKLITENVSTEIYLPNSEPDDFYHSQFDLTEEEKNILATMANEPGKYFLLKHKGKSVIIDFDLSYMKEIIKILSADEISNTATQEVIAHQEESNKNLVELWIPELINVLKEIQKEKKQSDLDKIKEERKRIAKERLDKEREEDKFN